MLKNWLLLLLERIRGRCGTEVEGHLFALQKWRSVMCDRCQTLVLNRGTVTHQGQISHCNKRWKRKVTVVLFALLCLDLHTIKQTAFESQYDCEWWSMAVCLSQGHGKGHLKGQCQQCCATRDVTLSDLPLLWIELITTNTQYITIHLHSQTCRILWIFRLRVLF